jgi:hypothetical protein
MNIKSDKIKRPIHRFYKGEPGRGNILILIGNPHSGTGNRPTKSFLNRRETGLPGPFMDLMDNLPEKIKFVLLILKFYLQQDVNTETAQREPDICI